MASMSRRQALAGIGSVSLGALLAACGGDDDGGEETRVETTEGTTSTVEPSGGRGDLARRFDDATTCTRAAEQTEGPFYFDVDSIRSDIREDREGTPLRLGVRVREAGECRPLANAVVDVWHCDPQGVYSGFEAGANQTFLRGAQVTDADGIAEFTTVYPGGYTGRTVHIHAKLHIDRQTVLTTQFYFDDGVSEEVFDSEPYASNGDRDTTNEDDALYSSDLELSLSRRTEGGGYLGLITLDVA
jgi:protocatechuate 3,4-dioxygenase beta subunit